jgi:hypothetical protein
MVADHEWFSPTRFVGLAAYTASLVVCGVRWANCRKSYIPGGWFALLAGVQLYLLLDMAFDWRWKIHDFWARDAVELGAYDERRPPQALALVVLFVVVILAAAFVLRRFRGRAGLALALTGTLLSVGLWGCESISFHYMDMVLYHMVGGVMVVSLVWISLAAVTCWGAWLDGQSYASRLFGR